MLSEKNMMRLKEHAKEHKGGMASKHMKDMKKHMTAGDSFSVAHKKALKPMKKDKAPPSKRAPPKRKAPMMKSSNSY